MGIKRGDARATDKGPGKRMGGHRAGEGTCEGAGNGIGSWQASGVWRYGLYCWLVFGDEKFVRWLVF